jgi:hypothetical protein
MSFLKKKNSYKIDQKSLLQTALSIFFDLTGLQKSTATICFCTTSQRTIIKNIGSQRVYSGPQGLAFCSGNSDQDLSSTIVGEDFCDHQTVSSLSVRRQKRSKKGFFTSNGSYPHGRIELLLLALSCE